MRSLETRASREAKEQGKRRMISIVLLAIMVLSTAGYAFVTFEGHSGPAQAVAGSQLTAGGRTFTLANSKEDVSGINAPVSLELQDYLGKNVYIDSNFPAGSREISSTLGTFAGKLQDACYLGCNEDLPEKNCSSLLIVLNSSAPNSISQNENCVFINGNMREVDAFLYKVLQ